MQQLDLETKALLSLYNAPEHPDHLCSDNKKNVEIFLPPNVTSLVQPMDQNITQTVKLHYRKVFLKRTVASEEIDICF